MNHDEVTTRLEAMEERFDAHGHDSRIQTLQTETIGVSVLRCHNCGGMAEVWTKERNGWFLPTTILDLRCEGGGDEGH